MAVETTTVDLSLFEARLGQLSAALHVDGGKILEDEARLFLKAVMKVSPPKNKAQGEAAIERDGRRIFGVVEDAVAMQVAQDFGTDYIRHWVTSVRKDGERYEVEWDKIDIHGDGMEAWHKAHRNPRTGHTNRIRFGQKKSGAWVEQYVVPDSAFKNWLKRTVEHVGTLRSAWGSSFEQLGGRVPQWIKRNINRRKGQLVGNVNHPTAPFVRMTNRADGIMETQPLVNIALRIRLNAITRRLNLITGGYAQDIVQKLKVNPKAYTTPESFHAE